MDSWLIYKLTNMESFLTDYSNAARTQLFNIHKGKWDVKLCELFEVPIEMLPEVRDSNSCFGYTDIEGILDCKVPICGVMGDSNSALFGQKLLRKGMVKVTMVRGFRNDEYR
jgi:glycerol kinase